MCNKEWTKHLPIFESDQLNLEMMVYSPWSGHRLFAYDFIVDDQPECIVELGSFYGCSSFAFLQAIKDYHLNSCFYAIDTWEGDDFTENDYREDIYGQFKKVKDTFFVRQNVQMLQMTFDDAVKMFENGTIDLLHIDGSHRYEDVRRDFLNWKEKVKKTGVVFFHDIGDVLLEGKTLGSHVFWEELKLQYSYTFEFPFSFGLGVLCFDGGKYESLKRRIDFLYYQQQANCAAVQYKDTIRKQYFQTKNLEVYIESLRQQVEVCQMHLGRYKDDVKAKDDYITELESRNNQLADQCQHNKEEISRLIDEKVVAIDSYKKTLTGKERYIAELQNVIEEYADVTQSKNAYIQELEKAIADYQSDDETRKKYISELEDRIGELTETIDSLMSEIDRINTEYEGNLKAYQTTEKKKEGYIAELQETIGKYSKLIEQKEGYIAELQGTISKYATTVEEKEKYIKELHQIIAKCKQTIEGKEFYVSELLETISKYKETVSGKDVYIQELLQDIRQRKTTMSEKEQQLAETMRLRDLDRQSVLSLEAQVEEHKLELKAQQVCLTTLKGNLRTAMINAQKDEDMIVELQNKLDTIREQIAELKLMVSNLPFGQWVLKRMELQSD